MKSSLSSVDVYEGSNEEKNGETQDVVSTSIRLRTNIKTISCVYKDSEIWGNAVWGGGVKIPVNIWHMLDWILTQNCGNTLSLCLIRSTSKECKK